MTAVAGSRLRLGVEVLQANRFGKHSSFKERATLLTPMLEFEFSPVQQFNPYLVVGAGIPSIVLSNQTRCTSSIPCFQSSKFASLATFNDRSRVCCLRGSGKIRSKGG